MKNALDKIIFMIFLIMIAFPYERAIFPVIGEINIKAILLAVILVLCILKFVLRRKKDKYHLIGFVATVFILYFAASILLGADIERSMMQAFTYTPFLISCLLITTGTVVRYEMVAKGLVFAVTISGALASFIFYFNPSSLPSGLGSESALAWGRLPWRGSSNVIAILGLILFTAISTIKKWPIILSATAALIVSLLTFNRTSLLTIIFIISFWSIYTAYSKNISKLLVFYAVFFVSILVGLSVFNFENILRNIEYRIFGFLGLTSDVTQHIDDRMVLYSQYYEMFVNYFPLGAGFDVPFATYPEVSTYSDVTLVSFVLPFGFFGLMMFLIYILKLWSLVNLVKSRSVLDDGLGFKIVILVGIFASFNDDIWSHKEFSMVVSLLIASYVKSYREYNGNRATIKARI